MTPFSSHDRSFACFFTIFAGHRRKAIQAKLVDIGPLIMIIIIILLIIILIIIIKVNLFLIIIKNLPGSFEAIF